MSEDHITEEQWRASVGGYAVSNLGRVRRECGGKGATIGACLKARNSNSGYPMVHLYKDNKRSAVYVHRLVAQAFIGTPPSNTEVNHIDCDKTNNKASNLEYVTRLQNMLHAHGNGCFSGIRKARPPATHCRRGHPRNKENAYTEPSGIIHCRVCHRMTHAEYKKRVAERMVA